MGIKKTGQRTNVGIWFKKAVMAAMAAAMIAGVTAVSATAAGAEPAEARETAGAGPKETRGTAGGIELEASYGYQGAAKSGRYLPLKVTIRNLADQPFEGSLDVLSMESDYQVYRYEYPVTIGRYGEQQQSLSVSVGPKVDRLYVRVLAGDGQVLARKRLNLSMNGETAELFMGVLSDTPDKLHYMDGIGINYSSLRTKMLELTRDTFPSQKMDLDLLDVILITNFNTRSLSDDQREALWDWVNNGGTLLIGTGARGEDAMGPFSLELMEWPTPKPALREVNMGVEYATDGPEGATIPLVCWSAYMKGANEILSSDELPVLMSVAKGNGMVAVASYDFTDIEAFCQENPAYMENLLIALLGEDKINELTVLSDMGSSSRYWSVQSLINSGDTNKLPKISLYVTVAVCYMILAGPGLYFFLRQRELMSHYRGAVAALSLFVLGIVYVLGVPTRFRSAFFTYATIKDVASDGVSETTYVNVRAPYSKSYEVGLDSSYTVHPLTGNYNDGKQIPEFTGDEEPAIAVKYSGDVTGLQVASIPAFTSKYFELGRHKDNSGKDGFDGEVRLFDGRLSGTVTSHFSQPVEDAALLLYGQYVPIGRMEPGQTVDLSDKELIYGTLGSGYVMAERITGANRYQEADGKDESRVRALERANLLAFYMDNYMRGYRQEAKVVGFYEGVHSREFLTDQDCETYGATLVTSSVEVDYTQGEKVYRFALQKRPTVVSGEYSNSTNTVLGITPVVLEYYLGNDLAVEKVHFYNMNPELAESPRSYTKPFSGNMYFYNYDSGSYDLMDTGRTEYSRKSLEPYLSPGNTLTVKYVCNNVNEYNWNIMLPMLTATGEEK